MATFQTLDVFDTHAQQTLPYVSALKNKAPVKECLLLAKHFFQYPTRRDRFLETPLELSLYYQRPDVAQELLSMGFCPFDFPERRNVLGQYIHLRPVDAALVRNYTDFVLQAFSQYPLYCVKGFEEQWFCFQHDSPKEARIWRQGAGYLHIASVLHNYTLLEFFLKSGLDPNTLDQTGISPLQTLAISCGTIDMALLLLSYGADATQLHSLHHTRLRDQNLIHKWQEAFSYYERKELEKILDLPPNPRHHRDSYTHHRL